MDCKIRLAVLTAFILSLIVSPLCASPVANSPVGYWKTIDNVTGNPKNIIQISQDRNHHLTGKIVKVLSANGKKNLLPVGTVVLSDLQLVDLENGKTYSCSMRMTENGKKLKVSGYIGLPLFGHSQTWERVDLMAG